LQKAKKREMKVTEKALVRKAKECARANRSEDIDFFIVYYNDKYCGMKFLDFKKTNTHPWKIIKMLEDE